MANGEESTYVGEIRMFAGSFAPAGWLFCEGQLLSIDENQVLYQLIGTTYGGNGNSNFGLPDLRGRVPVHVTGSFDYQLGTTGGTEQVVLTTAQLPAHGHTLALATTPGDAAVPGATSLLSEPYPANTTSVFHDYDLTTQAAQDAQVTLAAGSIGPAGGGAAHGNVQPLLAVNFIISLVGVYPVGPN